MAGSASACCAALRRWDDGTDVSVETDDSMNEIFMVLYAIVEFVLAAPRLDGAAPTDTTPNRRASESHIETSRYGAALRARLGQTQVQRSGGTASSASTP